MNHTLRNRSALRGHNDLLAAAIRATDNTAPSEWAKKRALDDEWQRRAALRRQQSGQIAAVCAAVIGVYLLIAFIAQVLA